MTDHCQLFGPVQGEAALTRAHGPKWIFPGTALTASTALFWFDLPTKHALRALFRVIWMPRNLATAIRLVHADDGPTNIVEMAVIQSDGSMTPRNNSVLVTEKFNELVAGKTYKNLGFQTKDNGRDSWTLFEVCLEIHYAI